MSSVPAHQAPAGATLPPRDFAPAYTLPDAFGPPDRLLAPRDMQSSDRPPPPVRVRNGARGYRRFLLENYGS